MQEEDNIKRVAIIRIDNDAFEPIKCIILTDDADEDGKTIRSFRESFHISEEQFDWYDRLETMQREEEESFRDFKERIDRQFSFFMNREILPPV